MIVDFKTYENREYLIPIVGYPSGEYFDITINQFNDMNDFQILKYDQYYRVFIFDDKDVDNIKYIIDKN